MPAEPAPQPAAGHSHERVGRQPKIQAAARQACRDDRQDQPSANGQAGPAGARMVARRRARAQGSAHRCQEEAQDEMGRDGARRPAARPLPPAAAIPAAPTRPGHTRN
ncbi:MAG: hypothetical protein ACUVWZ_10445 [Anaerolineae bacterium]